MDAVHVHLLLNHVPILGAVAALALLAAARWRSNDSFARAGLWTLVVVGAVAVAVYLSGEGAEETVERLPGVTEALIESHEEAAVWTLIAGLVAGVAALGALFGYRVGRIPRPVITLAALLALAVSAVGGWTAYRGGQIRHTEIRPGSTGAAPAEPAPRAGEPEEGVQPEGVPPGESAAEGESTEVEPVTELRAAR